MTIPPIDPTKLLIAQLMATRDALVASVGQIDVALLALGVDVEALEHAEPDCPHPPELVRNHHMTLDDAPDDFECLQCHARQATPFHSD